MTAPIARIIRSIVSQRGMRFAGFVMAWTLRELAFSDGAVWSAVICFTWIGKNWQFGRLRLQVGVRGETVHI
jgi:hypothetical protein